MLSWQHVIRCRSRRWQLVVTKLPTDSESQSNKAHTVNHFIGGVCLSLGFVAVPKLLLPLLLFLSLLFFLHSLFLSFLASLNLFPFPPILFIYYFPSISCLLKYKHSRSSCIPFVQFCVPSMQVKICPVASYFALVIFRMQSVCITRCAYRCSCFL